MSQASNTSNTPGGHNGRTRVAIVLTDGNSNVDPDRTIPEARLSQTDGIDIIVIGSQCQLFVLLI